MTNFIFSRRDLQRSINRLAQTLDPEALRETVAALNRQDRSRLPKMWELVILDAFSQVAQLRHEIALPSGRRPDFELSLNRNSRKPLLIVGDITTISDAGLDDQNPIETLFLEGPRVARLVGLDPNHLGYKVDGDRVGRPGDARVKLQLPPKAKLIEALNGPVKSWMREVKSSGASTSVYEYAQDGHRFICTYDQAQKYHTGSYTSYDVAASKEKNPLYKALKAKRDQLDGAPEESLRMIVVCDGDSAILGRGGSSPGHGSYSARQVASHFLNKGSYIDAVLLCTVESVGGLLDKRGYRLRLDLEVADRAPSFKDMSTDIQQLEMLIRQACDHFPMPYQMPVNAAMRCLDSAVSQDHNGAYQHMSSTSKVSARGLLALLAGKTTLEQYRADHAQGLKLLESMHEQGRTICAASIQPMDYPDDDWIAFEFGEPDPAATAFIIPAPSTDQVGGAQSTPVQESKQSALSKSWDTYTPQDQRRIIIAFVIVGLCIVVGTIGAITERHVTWFFNIVACGMIVAQGFIGACSLKHQAGVSCALTLISLAMVVLSLSL